MNNLNYTEVNKSLALTSKILKIFYYGIIVLLIYLIMRILDDLQIFSFISRVITILLPLIIGFLLAWLLDPLINYLCKNNFNRLGATVIVYIILLVILYLIIAMLIPVIGTQIDELISSLPDIISKISNFLIDLTKRFDGVEGINSIDIKNNIIKTITDSSNYILTSIPNYLLSILSGVISFLGLLSVGLVIGFYLLLNFDKSMSRIGKVIKKYDKKNTIKILRKINVQMYRYIKGTLISSLILFITSTISFMIIGLKVPILFGLFCAITNIIPFVGPYIGGIPAVLFAYSQSSTIGLLCLIVIVATQLIESNVITPLIMSKTMKIHPVTVIVALLLFGAFGGIIGMIIAVPVISMLKIIYESKDEYLVRK